MTLSEQIEIDIKMTKEFILHNRYGKFDLLERLIPMEKLLYAKTRVLLVDVLVLLDMLEKDFPYTGFKMWISRYRRNHTPPPASIENRGKRYERYAEKENEQEPKKQKVQSINDDWLNFKYTDPVTLEREPEEIKLELVLPTKINDNHN
jgi:hypothetical protein